MSYCTSVVKDFKDGQKHVESTTVGDLVVSIRGNTYADLFEAASLKEAWDSVLENKGRRSELQISCLIGQRSDRRFSNGGSFDLKVVAEFINPMKFDIVRLLDPHSDVACALINNSVAIDPSGYVETAYSLIGTNPVLISPDAGAYKKVHGMAETIGADLVPANKVRLDGEPKIQIQGFVEGLDCLIVDDIADGGRTFMSLADELKNEGAKDVYLYVTHGMFNFGLNDLAKSIKKIYCTNSFRDIHDPVIHQINIFNKGYI